MDHQTENSKMMYKKTIFCIISLLLLVPMAMAQDRGAREKIESARIALITERLGLTPEQAERFWPLYNEYTDQRKELVRELQEARQNVDLQNMTEEQGQQLMRMGLEIKERQLQLEKNYSERLTKVISAQQLLSLRKAEDDFRRMIIQRLEERKRQQMRREEIINRREEIQKNRGNN